MLTYYHVERDKELRYVIELYYIGLFGNLKEMHRSVHSTPKAINEVITYYRKLGYKVQSLASA